MVVSETSPKKSDLTSKKNGTATVARRKRRSESSPGSNHNETTALSLDDPSLYLNREISLLAFQTRVLEEAQDEQNPLLERVKFLSIVGSNLDEFFMVRVAGLKGQLESGALESGPDGMTPSEELVAIRERVTDLYKAGQDCLRSQLLPGLKKEGIHVVDYAQLTQPQAEFANRQFSETVFPTLTPLAFDPGRPFPHISNLSLNLAVLIRDLQGVEHFARVKVPDSLPQLVPLQSAVKEPKSKSKAKPSKPQYFVWLEQLIVANLQSLFPGMEVIEAHPFHVTRDAETAIQQLEAGDLLESVEEGVWQRRFADVVRMEINDTMPSEVLEILLKNLEIERGDVYKMKGPLALSRLKHLLSLDRPDLKDKPFVPSLVPALQPQDEGEDIFSAIRRQDVLLHHPFDSFQPVVAFLQKAARDPAALAIKITLYRVGRNAPVVEALLEAIDNGKQVAVLVELKARFDEESNIEWARRLEREGVHVVYGLMNLKVHCKAALVVRQEKDRIRRYVHLSTGNYNTVTAQLYTDIGLLTCDEAIGEDCTDLFNYLTGYSAKIEYRKLLVAPVNLRDQLEHLIRREIEHQKSGKRGHLIFKMNALVDRRVIQLFYEASQAGVQVDLLVRGICCLRPGIPNISENIRVTSIVGRFLEHSRIFYFHNGGQDEVYLGSADMMPRNLNRRVELAFPVQDPKLVRYLRDEVLDTYLSEVVKARHMNADGTYSRAPHSSNRREMNSQEWFIKQSSKRSVPC
ncbi:MAG: polyphosphate kinase 1 [Terriglobales bacterium]|jgi:polyphosphate kinase